MKTLHHFFDVVKQEVTCKTEDSTHLENEETDVQVKVKQESIIKEELDIPWDETNNTVEKNPNNVDSLTKHTIMFDARVILDKLSESTIQKHLRRERNTIKIHEKSMNSCNSDIISEDLMEECGDSSADEECSQFYSMVCTECNKKYEMKNISKCQNCQNHLLYECKKCQRQVKSIKGIRHHITYSCVSREYYYKCIECDYRSAIKSIILSHVKDKHSATESQRHSSIQKIKSTKDDHDKPRHKCSKCGNMFKYFTVLMKHIQSCTGSRNSLKKEKQNEDQLKNVRDHTLLYCEKCDKEVDNFAPKSSKENNGNKKLDRKKKICFQCKSIITFKCKECKKSYITRDGLALHIRTNHSTIIQEYKCFECDYKTHVLARLTAHSQNKHRLRAVECPTCKLTFKNKKSLSSHQWKICKNPLGFQCNHCSYKSKSRDGLEYHILRWHSSGNEIECPKCKKMQKNKLCLKDHLRFCKRKRHETCKFCAYETKYSKNLKRHVLSVHGISDYDSTVNEKSMSLVSFYQCDDCSYKSKIKQNLYDHIVKIHLRENGAECSRCKETFRNHVYLSNHLKYCGLKPYLRCTECPFKTYLEGKLTAHMKDYHVYLECSDCARKLRGKSSLRYHIIHNCKKKLKTA